MSKCNNPKFIYENISEKSLRIGDTWISVDWYSLKFHNSLPKAWSRVEEETAERF